MRAAVTEAFGGVERLVVREIPKPAPGPGQAPLLGKRVLESGHARGKIVVRP